MSVVVKSRDVIFDEGTMAADKLRKENASVNDVESIELPQVGLETVETAPCRAPSTSLLIRNWRAIRSAGQLIALQSQSMSEPEQDAPQADVAAKSKTAELARGLRVCMCPRTAMRSSRDSRARRVADDQGRTLGARRGEMENVDGPRDAISREESNLSSHGETAGRQSHHVTVDFSFEARWVRARAT